MHIKVMLLGGSAALVNALLAAASEHGATVTSLDLSSEAGDMTGLTVSQGNAPSTSTGTGTPVASVSPPSAPGVAAPMPVAPSPTTIPMPTESSDDEEGTDSAGVELDSAGLPWDERIHSSSRKIGKDGTWNKRRGGPSGDELAAIEAELRGAQTAPAPVPAAPVAPAPVPAAPVAPAPAPVEQPAAVEWDFPSFMSAAGPKFGEGAGMLDAAYLVQVCAMYGLTAITDLGVRPEMIPTIIAQFQADGRW